MYIHILSAIRLVEQLSKFVYSHEFTNQVWTLDRNAPTDICSLWTRKMATIMSIIVTDKDESFNV